MVFFRAFTTWGPNLLDFKIDTNASTEYPPSIVPKSSIAFAGEINSISIFSSANSFRKPALT